MAKYIVEESNYKKYEKNYLFPFINLIPGIVWSIPLHQKLFPDASWWMTFGLCAAFVVESEISKIYDNADFGYTKIVVDGQIKLIKAEGKELKDEIKRLDEEIEVL